MEIDVAHLRRVADRVADLGRHVFDASMRLHEAQGFLRADASHTRVEVGSDQDGEVDELCARDLPGVQLPPQLDDIGTIGLNVPASGGIPCPRWSGSARGGAPRTSACRNPCWRRPRRPACAPCAPPVLHLRPGLHGRQPEQTQQLAGLADHLPRQPRGHRRLPVRRREIALCQRLGVFAFELALDLAALLERRCLTGRRRPVEDEHEPQPVLGDKRRRAKEQAGEMRGDSPVRVPQRRAVAEPDQREELIQLAVAVDGQDLLPEIAERDGLVLDDRTEDTPTSGS